MSQGNITQETVVTVSALRAAAEAIPPSPPDNCPFGLHMSAYQAECTRYHNARAEFWRLAYETEKQNRFHNDPYNWEKWRDEVRHKADIIVAEVEARS